MAETSRCQFLPNLNGTILNRKVENFCPRSIEKDHLLNPTHYTGNRIGGSRLIDDSKEITQTTARSELPR